MSVYCTNVFNADTLEDGALQSKANYLFIQF